MILTTVFWNCLLDFPRNKVRYWIEGFHLIQGRTALNVLLADPDLMIDRADLLNFLYARVAYLGAQILKQVRFAGIPDPNGIVFWTAYNRRNSIDHVTHLVIADGVHSPSSRVPGLHRFPMIPILQTTVIPPAIFDLGRFTCWFDPHQTPFSFRFTPHGTGERVPDVVTRVNQPIRRLLDDFTELHRFHPSDSRAGA